MGPNYVLAKGFVVDAAATNVKAGRAAIQGSSNTVVTTAGAAADVLGVYINEYATTGLDAAKIATGKATIGVQLLGIVRVEAGASFSRRARLTTDSVGRAVNKAQAAAGQPGIVFAIALTPASAAGDQVDALLVPGSMY
jgi:UDP-N-acetylmuramoylalanine-D-glutamate ligase